MILIIGLNESTKYEYAINKLNIIKTEYIKEFRDHGFVIISDTFLDYNP